MRRIAMWALLVGCASNQWVAYSPVSGTTKQTKPTVVQRAVIAITDAGQEIESSDGTTGIVLSKWFFGVLSDTRFQIRVTVDDAGYQVVALCQRKGVVNSASWEDCEQPDRRPQFVVDTVTKVDAALR